MARKLINYLPHVVRDVREYRAIMDSAEQPKIEALWLALDRALNDQFIPSSTEYGVERWEKMLKIIPGRGETLEDRKLRILLRLNEDLPYTIRFLRDRLTQMFGEGKSHVAVDHLNYIIRVGVEAKNLYWEQELMRFIEKIKPANMAYKMNIRYKLDFDSVLKMAVGCFAAVVADVSDSGQLE
jgi:uncharacterized protein YmfQ (DUF2313 family)